MTCIGCGKHLDKFPRESLRMNDYDAIMEDNKTIFCDDCVLYVLESRRDMMSEKLSSLEKKICKVKENKV